MNVPCCKLRRVFFSSEPMDPWAIRCRVIRSRCTICPSLPPPARQKYRECGSSAPRTFPWKEKEDLQFYNGYGGFSADGREYVIETAAPARTTPAPWVNVIGYPEFGFMVSEAGSQCTWALNSGENRLTPWSNDPVRDPTGEALYLRDEETGEVWTPTPFPCRRRPTLPRHPRRGLHHFRAQLARPPPASDAFCQPGRPGQNYPPEGGKYPGLPSPDHRHAVCRVGVGHHPCRQHGLYHPGV